MAEGVQLLYGVRPYREALAARLRDEGFEVIDGDSVDTGQVDAVAVFVGDELGWEVVADRALWTPTVAVLPSLDVDGYVRALALGAGAVIVDSPTAVMVDVIRAALLGESRLPLAVAQMLALHIPPTNESVQQMTLNELDEALAELVLEGLSTADIGDRLGFSERTVRRRLQGLYLKLGVANRDGAVRVLTQRAAFQGG